MNPKPFKVTRASRAVIEDRVLATLQADATKVAILATKEDLDLLILCLKLAQGDLATLALADAEDFEQGLITLREGVFGPML